MNSIGQIQFQPLNPNSVSAPGPQAPGAESFKDLLIKSIGEVNSMQQQADASIKDLFTGGDANPAEVLTAVQKADLAFKMMMQVRNKLVQAYQEIQDIRI